MMQPRINENQIQKILSGKVIIEDFSIDKTYQKSVLIKYNNNIYLSLYDISAGDFDDSQWLKITGNTESNIDDVKGEGNIITSRNGNIIIVTSQTFIFEQGISSSNWYIKHNLNKFPSVTVVDSSGNEIICDVKYIDLNTCILTMNAAFKGKAFLN